MRMHVFDIIGPVMIGPSSSHTAGAARIGRVARRLLGEAPVRADVGLYGSFASTYRGHGTDRAIAAGLLDMGVDDPRLRDALELARASSLQIHFHPIELRDAHPNTAVVRAEGVGRAVEVEAASVGGGAIRVVRLDGLPVDFSGDSNTIVIRHRDEPGVIAQVSGLLAGQGVNIATMQVFRSRAGGDAVMVLEVDELPEDGAMGRFGSVRGVRDATLMRKI
jgi:L-serine dehydratase